MSNRRAEWLENDVANEEIPFAQLLQTLRDVCGEEVALLAPHDDVRRSHLYAQRTLTEKPARDETSARFTAGGATLFLREEDFRRALRSSVDYGDFFWVTIETGNGVFRVYGKDS